MGMTMGMGMGMGMDMVKGKGVGMDRLFTHEDLLADLDPRRQSVKIKH